MPPAPGTVERMHWMPDTSAGEWLRERLGGPGNATIHTVVPHGFPAYARILHPAFVRSLPDRPVPTYDEYDRMTAADQQSILDRFVDRPATWAEAASVFGTTLHPLAQWSRIVRTPPDGDWTARLSPDGREFTAPIEGFLSAEMVATIATHLVSHTRTPDAGVVALWEGTGGLLGHLGHRPSRSFLSVGDDPNHRAMLDRSIRDPLNNAFRTHTWQEGILSREISEGPRFTLPDRDHVLFRGDVSAFARADWILDMPWRDREGEAHGFEPSAQSPSILWPDDHAWVMVSDVDADSTIVAGSPELIAELCADAQLEAFPISEGVRLTWDADEVNR